MVRFAAAVGVLAVLVVASLVWAAERPRQRAPERPTTEPTRLAKGSVTTRAIRNNTIQLRDLRRPLRRLVREPGPPGRDGEDGQDGLDGDDGEEGLDGEDGEDGEDGVSGYEVVRKTTEVPADQASASDEVDCPGDKVVVGGGALPSSDNQVARFNVAFTGPQDDNSGWQASVTRAGPGPWTLRVQAICTYLTPER
ncbi:MAG: hypothetical protein ICV69_12915 [Thermoleophilaceae bacterium]|nr:hypothetical protein [Thermoleophilaceae bacterium]